MVQYCHHYHSPSPWLYHHHTLLPSPIITITMAQVPPSPPLSSLWSCITISMAVYHHYHHALPPSPLHTITIAQYHHHRRVLSSSLLCQLVPEGQERPLGRAISTIMNRANSVPLLAQCFSTLPEIRSKMSSKIIKLLCETRLYANDHFISSQNGYL